MYFPERVNKQVREELTPQIKGQEMDTAIIGLIGVLIGAAITVTKDWWFYRVNVKQERAYLAIQITCLLERFVSGCAAVYNDNGTAYGMRDEQGCLQPQVNHPKFEPLSLPDLNWRALPKNLMYDILRLPSEIESSEAYIAGVSEFSAHPPDYEEFFKARKKEYVSLGVKALDIIGRLCDVSGIPKEANDDDWSPEAVLEEAYKKMNEKKR